MRLAGPGRRSLSCEHPLIEQILGVDGLKVCWTRLFRNSYGQLSRMSLEAFRHPTVAVDSDPLAGKTDFGSRGTNHWESVV